MGRGVAWARVALGAVACGVVCVAASGSASHVAKGVGGACDGLRGEIDEIRAMVMRERAAASGGEAQVEAAVEASSVAEIVRTCFVKFVGDDEIARRVARLPGVDYVEENGEAHVEQSGGNWNLDRIDQAKLPLDGAQFVPQNQANGVRIYVVDTGVLSTHTEFGDRAKNVVNVSPDVTPGDEHGHGTICASIAAGNELGIARKADILGVKVFGKTGTGQGTSIIDGLEWIVKNAPGPSVISMSISSEAAAVRDAAIAASDAGHIVVVAAGNQDQDACIRAPGSAGGTGDQGGIITVASTGEGDKRSSFSSYGTCVDIFAPGEGIKAAVVRGTSDSTVALNTGTSMACPHVAGVAAGLLGKHNLDKDAAIKELFDTVTTGVITDTLGSPNKLVYAEARRELPPTVQGAPAPTAGGDVANTIAAPKNVAKTVRNGALGLLSVLGLFALLGAFMEWRRSNSEHAKLMREHRKKVAAAHQRRLKRKREKELQRQQLATVQGPPSSWSPISSLQSAGARLSGARASFRRAESASPRTGTSDLPTAQANAGSEPSADTEQTVSTRIISMLTSPRMSIRKPTQRNPTDDSCVDLNTGTEVTIPQASITASSAEEGVSLSPRTSTQQLLDESNTLKPSSSRSSTRAPRPPPVNDSDMV